MGNRCTCIRCGQPAKRWICEACDIAEDNALAKLDAIATYQSAGERVSINGQTIKLAVNNRSRQSFSIEEVNEFFDTIMAEADTLRMILWLNHGHGGIYGDDGEMRCAECGIDFKHDDVSVIAERLSSGPLFTHAKKQE